ncbi:MAG: hypothetical protein RLW62_20940 [Gammaproteobacteria bacterium]
MPHAAEDGVVVVGPPAAAIGAALVALFARWGLTPRWVAAAAGIPGSYWGGREAGLVRGTLYVRADTPLHSALHEGCHFVCADDARRATLATDAGGDDLEECAVCYLSIVLADALPGFGRARMLADMDAWGYSFRLGSAARWFSEDAADARAWLAAHALPTAWPPAA